MMRPLRLAVASALLSACAVGGNDPTLSQSLSGGTAAITLQSSSATVTQTSETEWALTKTGTVNTATQTVTWTITATPTGTVAGQLVVSGTMTVTNKGTGGATIGNIVVNLQTKSGSSWVTRSSDIADATSGDAATSAHVVPHASSENRSFFTENGASGSLLFMDASTNTVFSLVPEKTIQPGETETLLFSATFDNNVLNLATGTPIRTEIIVSFGNAASNPSSAADIDINGNGVIDPDEHRVRSVPTRFGLVVPPQIPSNSTPTLTDALDDITTTGTVSFTNAMFNLGATSGTVTVHYDAGANGGTITNCAHLTSPGATVNSGGFVFPTVNAIDLTACSTQTIGSPTCTPGMGTCGWDAGDVVTYSQVTWGDSSTSAGQLLTSNFFTVYSSGIVEIGIPGTGGFSVRFTSPTAIVNYLPAIGALAPLNADLIDPAATASGAFGGEVLALTLNVDFSALTGGTSGLQYGNLTLCGLSITSLNGTSVSSFLGLVNTLLGGGSNGYTIADLAPILVALNDAFEGGAPSTFAQDHLVSGACP